MRYLLFAAIFSILFYSCQSEVDSSNSNDQRARFAQDFKSTLESRFPDRTFNMEGEEKIVCTSIGAMMSFDTSKMFLEYEADTTKKDEVIQKFIDMSIEFEAHEKIKVELSHIVPLVRPKEILTSLQKELQVDDVSNHLVFEEYNDELIILYAEDRSKGIEYLKKEDFKRYAVTLEYLRVKAIKNLSKHISEPEFYETDHSVMIVCGGEYESSLILGDALWNSDRFQMKGDLLVTIPNKDIIMITGAEDTVGIEELKETSDDLFATGENPLHQGFFIWNGEKFVKWDK